MKSAQKGIEMKLIQILALATAMATVATAQNSGANSQPTPSPTPAAASKTAGAKKPAAKKAASSDQKSAAKAAPGTSAKTSSNNAASPKADPLPKSGPASAATGKPAVKTTTEPVKIKTTAATQSKGAPTPVVTANDGNNANAAKKTGTKKADTKKAPPAKAPAVVAIKPIAPVKKAPGSQTKSSAKSGVQVPAKAPAPGTAQKTPPAQTAEKPKPSARAFGAHGRRDPFVSPIVSKDGISRPAPNCTSGKRCLVIPELVLQGTVKDTSGKMMAVVANSIKKTYFLRENDQVFQGSVEKITSDSIIFREYVKDALGRETAREVVKKLVPPS
jgi:Tfp pilus assembly protein PilP